MEKPPAKYSSVPRNVAGADETTAKAARPIAVPPKKYAPVPLDANPSADQGGTVRAVVVDQSSDGDDDLKDVTLEDRTIELSPAEKTEFAPNGKPYITLDKLTQKLGFGVFHVQLLFIVSAIWMADAMEMMLISFVSPPLQCYFDLSDAEKALITSVVFIGMFFGSASWGWFQDRFGRKIGYFVSVGWVLVFGAATAFADNFYLVLTFRFMVGFGVAGSHVAVTIFTEFLPSDKRALFIVLVNVFWAVGSIIEAALAWIIMPLSSMEEGWRILIGVSCFPLVIVMFMWPVLPESPRYNLIKGRPERIEPVFRRAFRINKKEFPSEFEIDTRLTSCDFDDHSTAKGSCKDLFATKVL